MARTFKANITAIEIKALSVSDIDEILKTTDPADNEKINSLLDSRLTAPRQAQPWQRFGHDEEADIVLMDGAE
jgi:hypothetical protein